MTAKEQVVPGDMMIHRWMDVYSTICVSGEYYKYFLITSVLLPV